MAQFLNTSVGFMDAQALFHLGYLQNSTTILVSDANLEQTSFSKTWVLQLPMISILSSMVLAKCTPIAWTSRPPPLSQKAADPPQFPYVVPLIGHLVSYLVDAAGLASSIM